MIRFALRRWFLMALAVALLSGLWLGLRQGEQIGEAIDSVPRGAIVFGVMLLMAIPMDLHTMWFAIRRPAPVLLASILNMGVLPLVGFSISKLIDNEQLATGIIVASCVPCTLASVAVWTRRAGGNDAIAILVTMVTNTVCFIVTPLWLIYLTNMRVAVGGTFSQMALRLCLLLVLPIVLAQLLRGVSVIRKWADRTKKKISTAAQFGVLGMVWIGAVKSGVELGKHDVELFATDWLSMIGAVIAIHLLLLVAGHLLSGLARFDRADRIAVGFAASQKTITAGLYIALQFSGLAVLPMVAFHVSQLFVDTIIADRLKEAGEQSNRTSGTQIPS